MVALARWLVALVRWFCELLLLDLDGDPHPANY